MVSCHRSYVIQIDHVCEDKAERLYFNMTHVNAQGGCAQLKQRLHRTKYETAMKTDIKLGHDGLT